MKNKNTKSTKGITLVALIITIIVLLILAVVAIAAVNNTGIINYADNSVDAYKAGRDNEVAILQDYVDYINENDPSKKNPNGGNSTDPNVSILEQYLFGDSPEGKTFFQNLTSDGINYTKNDELGIAADDIKGITFTIQSDESTFTFYIKYDGTIYKFKVESDSNGQPINTMPSYGLKKVIDSSEERVGKYVKDENNNIWIILYDNETHGLQMISADTFENNNYHFSLGDSDSLIDWNNLTLEIKETDEFKLADLNSDGELSNINGGLERAIYSYNQAIETLNAHCENLFKNESGIYNNTYIKDVRCVGSNPIVKNEKFTNKNSENTTLCNSDKIPSLAIFPKNNENQKPGLCNEKGYGADNNYETDLERLLVLGINSVGDVYWLASRLVNVLPSGNISFGIKSVDSKGNYSESSQLWCVYEDYASGNHGEKYVRPVISLPTNIEFVEETDGSEGNPYTFKTE